MSKNSSYRNNLIQRVIDNSVHKDWDSAVAEWEIDDCDEDDELLSSCICGKENLRYLFTICNTLNGNKLEPIGSSCIKKFGRDELTEAATTQESLFKLYHAIEQDMYISLSTEFFSRKLLKHLYDKDAFPPTKHNKNNPWDDFDFLLKMFNKRDKSAITPRQQKKINAIIINSIKPYLEAQLLKKKDVI